MNRKKSFANLLKITCVMVCSCIGTQLVWADKTNSESITDTAMGTDCSVRVFGSDGTAKDIMDMLSDIETNIYHGALKAAILPISMKMHQRASLLCHQSGRIVIWKMCLILQEKAVVHSIRH